MMDAVAQQDPSVLLWDRMAGLRLRLRDSVSVDVLHYRGRCWYLLRNTLSRQQLRLSQSIYSLLAQMDGQRTLAQVYERLASSPNASPGMRQQLLTALTQLQAADMLAAASPQQIQPLIVQQQKKRRQQNLVRWLRLLSPRLPLVDPNGFLERGLPLVSWIFRPIFLVIWLLVVTVASLHGLMHWDTLALYGAQRLNDPHGWVMMVCLYPLVKGLHELGHAFTAKFGGADVNEMGITLLVFVPIPYVDASAASVFSNKYLRMLVGAAGIMVELLLATLALFVWLNVSDGLARDAAFAVMLIGGVSTLLFNGNPLLRFDGYYVLADAIEIPNLATRAARYYGYLVKRYLLGLHATQTPVTAPGERPWFLFFGAASTFYRLSISIGIAFFLIVAVPVLGTLLAAWLLMAQIIFPLGRQLHFLLFSRVLAGRRLRSLLIIGGLVTAALAVIAIVPLSVNTKVDGIVLMPEQALVRAQVDGFLDRQVVADESTVQQDDALFILTNPQLETDISVLRGQVKELVARRDAVGFDDRVARGIHTERLAEARTKFAELEKRQARLTVRSPGNGVLRAVVNDDHKGRLVRKGNLLAYIADQSGAIVRVVASQEDATRIREKTQRVHVRLANRAGPILEGQLIGEVPAASDSLPNAALGTLGGGAIQIDARDDRGLKTLQKVFAFDVAIPYTKSVQYVGSRVYVRFEHPSSPLLTRCYDTARRLVLSEIGE